MSEGPRRRPVRTSSEEPRVRFNWPPTNDELAQYAPERDTQFEAAGIQPSEPLEVEVRPATDPLALFPSETRAPRAPAVPQETSQTLCDSGLALVGDRPAALFPLPEPEPARVGASSPPQSGTPGDGTQTHDNGEDLEHATTEAMSTSGIAVSPSATTLDLRGTGDLADEIAHLQTLIGGLTEQIE